MYLPIQGDQKRYPLKLLNNSPEIDATRMGPLPVEKTAFKR